MIKILVLKNGLRLPTPVTRLPTKKIASRHHNSPSLQFAMAYSFRLTYSPSYCFTFSALLFFVTFVVKKNAPKLPAPVTRLPTNLTIIKTIAF